jgi:hypothetical protein
MDNEKKLKFIKKIVSIISCAHDVAVRYSPGHAHLREVQTYVIGTLEIEYCSGWMGVTNNGKYLARLSDREDIKCILCNINRLQDHINELNIDVFINS